MDVYYKLLKSLWKIICHRSELETTKKLSTPCCDHQDYKLSEGIKVHLKPGEEEDREVVLDHNPFKEYGTLSGIVKDCRGCPIEDALVKIFDSRHHPVAHAFTNKEGYFLFCLAPGNYVLKAVR